jgi:hypothetical protein
MNDSKLFANVSRNKMVTGLKQMLTIMGIPFNMIKIYSKYRIPEEYTKKFYYAIYSYLHKNYMDEFNNPNRYDNMQGEYKKKVTRITNAINHLRDFKKAYPDNIFLKQLSVDTVSNKMFFTEERKKDDALIESTMDDFQRLLDSNEYITVTDKYTGKEVKMNTSDFANDLVYYTIQAYGFTYNYQSFSYLIPPDYYNDNIKNYTASITDLFNKTIENEGIMNSIHVEFLLNNPDMIKEDTIGIERTYQNYTLLIEDYIEFLKLQSLNDREYLEKIPSIVGNSFLEQMFSLGVDRPLGSLTYQNPFNEGSNKNKLNPQSVLTLMKDFTVEPMKFYTSFKYKGEVFVKIEENDFSVKYMIAKSSNVVNSKSLQSRLTEKIQGLRNIKAINVTDATANQYIDYGLYSQPFMMSYLPDISGDLNIPRIKSREQRLSTIDAVYRPVETVDKVKIIDILTQQRKPGTSTFIKTLYDLANKYNVSVLDIIKNTGDVGNTTLYNELVQKSNSKNLEVDFHYFDDVLTISESSVQDKEGEENGNELPQTMFDVIRKLNETIGSNLDNLLLNLKDEYAGKLIYATPGAGKTFIASMSKNVIDFDNLLAQHITNIDSTAVRQPGQTIQDFIYNNLGTSGFQNNAFNEALKLMENGYTVLTGSKELIKRSDYVFTMPSTERFNKESPETKAIKLQEEIELANRFNIPITEISNLQDVLVEKPRVEETKISVEITNSKYTRADVMNNPDTAYVFTENTYSMSEFPDRVGGGTAVIRGLKNAYGIVTRKKYDYDTKEKVDYADTPEDFQEFTEINETLIDYIKESGKSKIVFPPGFANDKAKLPTRFAEWLQTALLDNFGLVTELNSTKTGLISKSVLSQQDEIQSKIDFQVETSGNTIGEMYRNRTIKNASADATIAIAVNFETRGEKLTKSSVVNQGKKYIPIDAKVLEVTESRVNKVVDMLNSVNAKTLNIAGNGIYTMKGLYTQEQLDEFSYQLIKAITESPNLKNKIVSIRSGGQTGFDEAGAKAGIRLGIPTTVLAPKGWSFRNIDSMDISNEKMFKERFKTIQQPETQTTIVEPKGKKVADGIYVNQESLTKEEQLELFDYLKPFLESQGKKTNKGANAPIMIGLNLRWDYKSNNPSLTPVNVGNNLAGRNTSYAYYDLSIDGKPLGKITQRFIELMNKSTGIDISNYDGAIINLYTNESFIGNHSDLEESATAEKYPVVVANIGGSGNIILGTDKNQIKVDLKSGASYLFGFKGKNRKIPHSTYASDVKGFLPSITISQEGKTFNTGSYRVSITMRRVMPLELGMPSEPIIISNINQQPTDTNEFDKGSGFNKECKTRE